MNSQIERPWALVTGASSGIGASYARALAAQGIHVALVARRAERLQDLAAEIEGQGRVRAEVIAADLAEEEGVARLEAWLAEHAGLRWLVHSAGFGTRDHFGELPAETTLRMLRLHVEAGVRLTRAALPALTEAQEGTVVLVSSLSAFFTTARYVTYAATKSYLNMFAEGLQVEVGPAGIRVQAICPGLTRTEFLETPAYADFQYDDIPAWAWMTADEVVTESLAALRHHDGRGPVVVIPGWKNRAFVRALQTPGLGSALRWGIDRLSSGKAY